MLKTHSKPSSAAYHHSCEFIIPLGIAPRARVGSKLLSSAASHYQRKLFRLSILRRYTYLSPALYGTRWELSLNPRVLCEVSPPYHGLLTNYSMPTIVKRTFTGNGRVTVEVTPQRSTLVGLVTRKVSNRTRKVPIQRFHRVPSRGPPPKEPWRTYSLN